MRYYILFEIYKNIQKIQCINHKVKERTMSYLELSCNYYLGLKKTMNK